MPPRPFRFILLIISDAQQWERLQAALRRIGSLLEEAGRELVHLADAIPTPVAPPSTAAAPERTEKAPARPKGKRKQKPHGRESLAWDWQKLTGAALQVLNRDRARSWWYHEFRDAVLATGVTIPTKRGLHFGLVARLKAMGAITIGEDRRIRAVVKPDAPAPALAMELSAPEPEEEEKDPIAILTEEIDRARPYMGDLSKAERRRELAIWAGRARAIQDAIAEDHPRRAALRAAFGRLTSIAREHDCGWIDALTPTWKADWDAYVEYHSDRPVPPEKEKDLYRALLGGLMNPHRRVSEHDAQCLIAEALAVLDEADPPLAEAIRGFGRPDAKRVSATRKRRPPAGPAAPREEAPPEVLARTRGRRALIFGGQGTRPEQHRAIQEAFGFSELEWVTSEKNKAAPFTQLAERIKPGRYDLSFYLIGHTSQQGNVVAQCCKNAGVPLVYIPRGYSVNSFAHSIREQLVEKAGKL